ELGIARAVGAVVFSVVIGLAMHFLFRKEEAERARRQAALPRGEPARPLWKNSLFFGAMVGVLVFANWGRPEDPAAASLYAGIYRVRFWIAGAFLLALLPMILGWFSRPELSEWSSSTWGFAKQILPLLAAGVLAAGLLLGAPGSEDGGIVPRGWVERMVSGNSLGANAFASVAGAFMYFATLTEVPILDRLIHKGMGQGPALALLLAGPALSLPNMLVIRSVMGTRKTLCFVALVVVMATVSGMIFGAVFG
ncbi:MAG: permease, partial [Planctomycetota bacterium]